MYRVVIADDEPIILKGLRETVEWDSLGLELAAEAANGLRVLEEIKRVRPQVLITDIRMPGMDGIQVIRAVKQLDWEVKIIILSAFSDYDYLKEAIYLGVESYLLKPIDNEELTQILTGITNKLDGDYFETVQKQQGNELLVNNTLNRLVTNSINLSEFKEKADFLKLNLQADRFICAVCTMEQVSGSANEKDALLLLAGLRGICKELIGERGCLFSDRENRLVILFLVEQPDDLKALVRDRLENIVESAKKILDVSLIVGGGCVVDALDEVWRSYDAAVSCLDYVFFSEGNRVIWCNEFLAGAEETDAALMIDENELKNLIRKGTQNERQEFVAAAMQKQMSNNRMSVEAVRGCFIRLAIITIGIFREYSIKPEVVERLEDFSYTEVLHLRQMNDFYSWYALLCDRLLQMKGGVCRSNTLMDNAIAYIEENYNKGLTIKDVAQACNVNASYLGQIFKKEIGVFFTDYVNRYRLAKAKDLLRDPCCKVYEVAERVGFTDYHYFLKIFKKLEGKLPSEIRK